MYCKMCGNLLDDTDLNCRICGAAIELKEKPVYTEEIIFNKEVASENNSVEQEEDKAEIIEDKEIKTDNIQFIDPVFPKEEVSISDQNAKHNTNNAEEFIWNIHEFPKEKVVEDIVFDWNINSEQKTFEPITDQESGIYIKDREEYIKEIEQALKPLNGDNAAETERISDDDTYETIDDIEKIIDNEIGNQTIDVQRFFTFNKKNEEFQELLDREYEKISGKYEGFNTKINRTEDTYVNPEKTIPGKTKVTEKEEIKIPDVGIPAERSHLNEMAEARSGYFSEQFKEDETKPLKEPEKTLPESETPPIIFPIKEDNQKIQKKGCIGRGFLILVAIVLLIEITILGIKYFLPDSKANDYIAETQTTVVNTITEWVESIKEWIPGGDTDKPSDLEDSSEPIEQEEPGKEPVTKPDESDKNVPDPIPEKDKSTLVASQLYQNSNIEQIKANDLLAYEAGKDYGNSDINNSKPIQNNIWITPENEDPVYYDRSIVGTIIAFDSQWIDYVNKRDSKVLELLKKDSKAYQNAVNYSKVGKINETFKLLEIGEIRQGKNGFYAWVHEEIQVTENGSTTNKKYNWIYYLEPINNQMKIVTYYKF